MKKIPRNRVRSHADFDLTLSVCGPSVVTPPRRYQVHRTSGCQTLLLMNRSLCTARA
jgi:hypothetical protein